MSDVFVSYSRKDVAFVRRLHDALERTGKDAWVDWQGIAPTADWMAEIYRAIEDGGTFVFVLSPDSVASEVCERELAHAAEHNKRIVPITCREVDPRAVPGPAARHHWISFESDERFDAAFRDLVEALDTNPDWVASHTHWLRRALDWEKAGRDESLLLRGSDLGSAEEWLAGQGDDTRPEATTLHNEYVHASRRASSRRQRRTTLAVAAALAISVSLGVVALVQRGAAVEQARIATARALTARAELLLSRDPRLGILLAEQAVRTSDTPEAGAILRKALGRAEQLLVTHNHGSDVRSAAFSGDGSRVISAGSDGTAQLWDARSGRVLQTFRGHVKTRLPTDVGVRDVDLSPDGSRALTGGSDKTIRLWDTATGRELKVVRLPRGLEGPNAVEFSRDGRRILATTFERVYIADARSTRLEATIRMRGEPSDAAFSPDGTKVVAATDSSDPPTIWDARSGRRLRTLRRAPRSVAEPYSASFSPDGRRVISASQDASARVWDAASGRLLRTIGEGTGAYDASFSPDGRHVVTAGDRTVKVWRGGRLVHTIRGHTDAVRSADFDPDGARVLTASADDTVRIWDPARGDPTVLRRLRRGRVPVTLESAAFSRDGTRLATAGSQATALVWGVAGGAPRTALLGARDKESSEATASPGTIEDAAVDPSGRLVVTAGRAGTRTNSRIWSAVSGKVVRELGHPPDIPGTQASDHSAAFSADGRVVLTAGPRSARIWDTRSGRMLRELRDPGSALTMEKARLRPDGRAVLTVSDDGVRVWDVPGRRVVRTIAHPGRVVDAAFSPDGARIVTTSSDRTARVWDSETGALVKILRSRTPLEGAELGPGGEVAATVTNTPLQGSGRYLSDDGAVASSLVSDATVRLWDVTSGQTVDVLRGGEGGLGASAPPALSRDGSRLAASDDGTIGIWSCEICRPRSELLRLAGVRAGRLSPAERREYLEE
ncbi:MAG: toll/interleukin-1 receptor domain-containing protein [Thermoleophilaceae bacterium]